MLLILAARFGLTGMTCKEGTGFCRHSSPQIAVKSFATVDLEHDRGEDVLCSSMEISGTSVAASRKFLRMLAWTS
jgi:hypothetical protein